MNPTSLPSLANRDRLCVAAFFDGRPGHEKQTRGILGALAELVELRVVEIAVPESPPLKRLSQLVQFVWTDLSQPDPRLAGVDLLLGTGSRTHLAMLLGKKRYRLPAVVCMAPAAPLRSHFDLCFVPEHDGLKESKHVVPTLGAPNCCRNLGQHREDRGLIAIGGRDEKSHRWDSSGMLSMVGVIVEQQKNVHWVLTSSPRTPRVTVEGLAAIAGNHGHVEFRDFCETSPGWIEEQYAISQTAWVSGDSISMLYEALSAGCRVGLLPVQWRVRQGKFQRNEASLLKKNLVLPFAAWRRGERWSGTAAELNEARRCAERILGIWQPKH